MIAKLKNNLVKKFGVFSKVKILENRVLNLLGIQVFRLLMAKFFPGIRRIRKGIKANSIEQKEFKNAGLVLKSSFLPSDFYEQLKSEVLSVIEDSSIQPMTRQYGPVMKYTYDVSKLPESRREWMTKFFRSDFIRDMFTYCELDSYQTFNPKGARYIEVVIQNEPIPGKHDYETELHSDTFYDTHKSWLYLTDVSLEDAPLVVVPKTHRLNWTRIKNEYLNSIAKKPEVSRRISERELNGSGQKELPIVCKENTLVVANTFAYHRRHDGLPGRKRIALHVSERSNPFKL